MKSVFSMCFVHKHVETLILGKFGLTCDYEMSRRRTRLFDFCKIGLKRCARLQRKKSWQSALWHAAVTRQQKILYTGGQIDPPPPSWNYRVKAPVCLCVCVCVPGHLLLWDVDILTCFCFQTSNIIALRNKHKDNFLKKHGVKLGFMSVFVKACSYALQDMPVVNAG